MATDKKFNNHMTKRRLTQIISLILLHSSQSLQFKWLCNPVLSCHSCALAYFACPVGVLTQYSGNHLFPFFAIGTILLIGALVGRLLCGWVCPFGLLQDLLFKIPTKKIILPQWTSYIKYFVLAFMVLLIPFFLGGETLYSFCRICPAAALQVSLPSLISEKFAGVGLSTFIRFSFLFLVIAAAIISSRSFCKTVCPIGAMMAPLNFISFWRVKIPEDGCTTCKLCNKVCIMDGSPHTLILDKKHPNRAFDCVVCHECEKSCPIKNGKNEDGGQINKL